MNTALFPPTWMAEALCATVGGDVWYPELGETGEDAKAICAYCPVRAQCLTYAIENGEIWGVWGGTSPNERRRARLAHADAQMSAANAERMQMWHRGYTDSEIADACGVGTSTIKAWRRVRKLPPNLATA